MAVEEKKPEQSIMASEPHIIRGDKHCFGCGKPYNPISDYYWFCGFESYWCKECFPERHSIITDYTNHAIYGT